MIARQESRPAEQVVPEKRVVDFHVEDVRPARAVEAEPLPGHVHEEYVPFPSVPAAQRGKRRQRYSCAVPYTSAA